MSASTAIQTASILLIAFAILPKTLKGQELEFQGEIKEPQWQAIAYLPFSPSSTGIVEALKLSIAENTKSTTSSGTEKVRTESLTRVDPVTGKTVSEIETTRSGTSNYATTPKNAILVVTLETRAAEKKEPKSSRQYRVAIEGSEFQALSEKTVKQATKLAREYINARRLVSKGANGKPIVELFLGDKEKGIVIYHETVRNRKDEPIKLRIWIKGKPYDLKTTDAASGFIDDVSNFNSRELVP